MKNYAMCLALFLHAGIASASIITASPVDSGKFVDHWDIYPDASYAYHVKGLESLNPDEAGEYRTTTRGYVVYDLTGIFGDIKDAYLSVEVTTGGWIDSHVIALHNPTDLFSAANLLAMPSGIDVDQEEIRAFNNFNPVAGYKSIPETSDRAIYDVPLNELGLDLVARKEMLVISIAWFSTESPEYDGDLIFSRLPELVLNVEAAEVPLPNTLSLLSVSFLALAFASRRRALTA